jgi:hypothetical protein
MLQMLKYLMKIKTQTRVKNNLSTIHKKAAHAFVGGFFSYTFEREGQSP